MRCKDCDAILSDFEATRKHRVTKKFLDLCNQCYTDSNAPPVIVRHDLAHDSDDYVYDEYNTTTIDNTDLQEFNHRDIDNY